MPIKSQNYIHSFFQENDGKEFIEIPNGDDKIVEDRCKYYYFFLNSCRNKNGIGRWCMNRALWFQKAIHFERKMLLEPKRGCNWISVTNDFVEYLLAKEPFIRSNYKYIPCVDEIAITTIFYHSSFVNNVFDPNNGYHSCMRLIDWQRGSPYTWSDIDFDELMSSDRIFARKFSQSNIDLVNNIVNALCKE